MSVIKYTGYWPEIGAQVEIFVGGPAGSIGVVHPDFGERDPSFTIEHGDVPVLIDGSILRVNKCDLITL
jgi:hypothetical protein